MQTAILSTQSALAQDYFSLRATDEQRRILDTTLADYEASLHLVRTLYNNGLASEEDLAEADTQLDSAEAQATDLGVARAQYEHAIAVLIGVPPSKFSIAVDKFNPALPAIPVGVPSDLLERRPDIAAAERQVAAANAGIGIARAAYFPTLTLSGLAGFESNGLGSLLDWPNRMWSIGPTLVQPIFDGGLRRAQNEQARAQYDATVANYRQTVLAAFQSVEDNLVEPADPLKGGRAAAPGRGGRAEHGQAVGRPLPERRGQLRQRHHGAEHLSHQPPGRAAGPASPGHGHHRPHQQPRGGWDASQLSDTEKTALHPPDAGKMAVVPARERGPGVPNPPPLPATSKRPEDILKQNEEDMSQGVSPAAPGQIRSSGMAG